MNQTLKVLSVFISWHFLCGAFIIEVFKSKNEYFLQVYQYWVDQPEGPYRIENVTVLTGEQQKTFRYMTKDGEILADLDVRPMLNCLYQGEEQLTIALLDNYLLPPPEKPSLSNITKRNTATGTIGASHWNVLQDMFLDEFIFKGQVKTGFFVEAGADDFMLNTNTLYFERLHGWTGLLVEPVLGRFHSGWV